MTSIEALSQEGSPPSSPYPGRRAPLPVKVELDLRTACIAVLTNQRPSHMISAAEEQSKLTAAKAQLDYAAIKASLDKSADVATIHARNRRSTRTIDSDSSEMAELQAAINPSKFAYKPNVPIADLFATAPGGPDPTPTQTANTVKRRDDASLTDPLKDRIKPSAVPSTNTAKIVPPVGTSHERPKQSQTSASQRSGSHGTNGSSPQTDAAEYPWSTSTAPTSAGVTPARNSKRASAHIQAEQDANFKSDAASLDWIRSEVDERRNNADMPRSRRPSELEKPDPRASRAPSRTRSIRSLRSVRSIRSITASMKEGIKDYIRPGSRSRDPSRPGSRSASRAAESRLPEYERGLATRPPPRRDWRNWGRSTKDGGGSSSSGDVSRSSSVRGRSENRKDSAVKAEVNLNRELPPLPGLSQWKEPEKEKQSHMVGLKSPSSRFNSHAAAINPSKSSALSEKDEIVATRLGSPIKLPIKPKPEVYIPRRPQMTGASTAASPPVANGLAKSMGTDGMRIEFTMNDLMGSNTATPVHSRSMSGSTSKHSDPGYRKQVPPSAYQAISYNHSRSGSSVSRDLSLKQIPSRTPSGMPKSTSNPALHSSAPSFSKHRKYSSTDIPPALSSNIANQGRKVTSKPGQEEREARYCHMAEISPPPVPPKDDKKAWWHLKNKQKKQMTWMDQLEKLGIKDGVLLNDEVAGSPIVRY